MPQPFHMQEIPHYSLNRRWVLRAGLDLLGKIKMSCSYWELNRDSLVIQPAA
jgi:hypothetical protein